MKVIFLDIDGVLNCDQTTLDRVNKVKNNLPLDEFYQILSANGDPIYADIDEEMVKILGKIVQLTGAKVVLSSTNRVEWIKGKDNLQSSYAKALQFLFNKYNIDIIGVTPFLDLDLNQREREIETYLKSHDHIEAFCIIDDDNLDFQVFNDYFIKTECYPKDLNEGGLREKHIETAVKLLNRQKTHLN